MSGRMLFTRKLVHYTALFRAVARPQNGMLHLPKYELAALLLKKIFLVLEPHGLMVLLAKNISKGWIWIYHFRTIDIFLSQFTC